MKIIKIKFYRILNILGCTPSYQCEVLGDAVQSNYNYIYDLKLISKTYRLFYINIKTYEYYNGCFRNSDVYIYAGRAI